jgi:Arc/MetJ-type ribon-helix-helix transcriptional regulator
MRSTKGTRTITLKLPKALAERLRSAVNRRGTTQSAVLREAITAHLEDDRRARRGSCLELAEDLAGSISGPRDLSSNPRHMKGYGR